MMRGGPTDTRLRRCAVVAMLGLVFWAAVAGTHAQASTDRYCGVFCVYFLAKSWQENVRMADLLKPEYVDSLKGSTVAGLARACRDHGLHAVVAERLRLADLFVLSCPVVLHLKRDLASPKPDHYVVFLADERRKSALVFDPPTLKHVPYPDLVARWEGTGVFISPGEIRRGALATRSFLRLLAVVGVAGLMTAIAFVFLHGRGSGKRGIRLGAFLGYAGIEATAIALGATVVALAFHGGKDTGLLANRTAVASIQDAHRGDFFARRSARKVAGFLAAKEATFIDARYPTTFRKGHLEGAINIPVNSSGKTMDSLLADVPKDTQVVVYCQSNRHTYAEVIAERLGSRGFSRVVLFPGGWEEWLRWKASHSSGSVPRKATEP